MLTKQQKLDVLSKAIDEGAEINIWFYDFTKSKAAVVITELAEMMGTPTEGKNGENAYWYQTHSKDGDLKINAFYELPKESYLVEDVVRTIEEVETNG